MQTETIALDREAARELYLKYRAHQHYAKPIDLEVQRTYNAIAKGRVVVKALDSIVKAGVGDDHYPKLAIVRADAEYCWLDYRRDGSAVMSQERFYRPMHTRTYIEFPAGSFPRRPDTRPAYFEASRQAMVPLIPLEHRPKRGLANYHILFEAVWHPSPPVDPMLLRRIGLADLWVVLAAWELTEVERAVLAGRV